MREASEDLDALILEAANQRSGDATSGPVRGASPWLGVVLGTVGISGLVVFSTLYLLFTIWGLADLASCVTDSSRPWFDPDDFTSYDRPIMCGNGMAWFAVAAPFVGWLLSSATSLMLLLGTHRPRVFVPVALILGAIFTAWLVWSQHVLTELNALERVLM